MKPQGIEIRCLAAVPRGPFYRTSERERCLGLGAECTKASAASSGRRKMSLDIPFYRTSERERCLGLGAECTKASAASSGRRKMSLDIPFYRTSERVRCSGLG